MIRNGEKLTAIILFFVLLFFLVSTKEVTMRAKVIHHAITSDKHGNITYNTLVVFRNHRAITLTGTEYYFVPVGDSVDYTTTEFYFPLFQ